MSRDLTPAPWFSKISLENKITNGCVVRAAAGSYHSHMKEFVINIPLEYASRSVFTPGSDSPIHVGGIVESPSQMIDKALHFVHGLHGCFVSAIARHWENQRQIGLLNV